MDRCVSDPGGKIHVALSSERPISEGLLKELFDSEPWWPERSLDDLGFILKEHLSVGAWHGDHLVGFARAVSDLRFRAYIEDVLVLADYRGDGIGRRLVTMLLKSLSGIHVITLFCQPRLSEYYVSLGFKEFTKQVVMHRRNVR